MPLTYEMIATSTFTTASAGITFNSIPATYTDLRLVFTGRSNGYAALRFNGSTSGYTVVGINGTGGNAQIDQSYMYAGFTTFGLGTGQPVLATFDIMGYADTSPSHFRVALVKVNADYNSSQITAFRGFSAWRNTAVVNSITFSSGDGGSNLLFGTVTLYGITRA